jgi:hypothetical protein
MMLKNMKNYGFRRKNLVKKQALSKGRRKLCGAECQTIQSTIRFSKIRLD